MEVVFPPVLGVLLLVGAVLFIWSAKKANRAWDDAAEQLHLAFDPPHMLFGRRRISGQIHGFSVVAYTFTRGSGKHSRSYTRFQVTYPSALDFGFRLTEQTFFSGVTKIFGSQDIEVGDPSFDQSVVIKGTHLPRIRDFLTPPRRVRISRFLSSHTGATIDEKEIQCTVSGVVRRSPSIVSTIRQMVRLGWHLTGDRAGDRVLEQAIESQHLGRVEEALSLVGSASSSPTDADAREGEPPDHHTETDLSHQTNEPSPNVLEIWGLEEKVLEGELLYLAGRRTEAKTAFDQALEQAPDDTEIQQWAERTAIEPHAVQPDRDDEVQTESALDVQSVCDAVFDPKNSSYNATRISEERFQGKRVSWDGTLRRVEPYTFDFVFGDGAGTKAVVEVCDVPARLFGETKVLTVVQLSEEAASTLELKIGQRLAFEGRLLKVDGFMRTFYVADGRCA